MFSIAEFSLLETFNIFLVDGFESCKINVVVKNEKTYNS